MSKTLAISASLGLAAVIGGTLIVTAMSEPADQFAQCRQGSAAGGAIGGPFTLVDETGATVTDQDVITQPSLIYFGYTFCPDVCPLDVARNAQAIYELDDRGVDVTPVFISIDPARDTPEVVAEFTDNFHERMIGLTGSEEQVAAASRAYKTYYRKQGDDPDYYLVDHSVFTYLTLPEYGFVDFFRRDMDPVALADAIQCYVDAAG